MNFSQFELAKNFFVEINKKARLLTVTNTIRERDRDKEVEKDYRRKVPMKNMKLAPFLLDLIYKVKDFEISMQAVAFFLVIYSSKENSS